MENITLSAALIFSSVVVLLFLGALFFGFIAALVFQMKTQCQAIVANLEHTASELDERIAKIHDYEQNMKRIQSDVSGLKMAVGTRTGV